MLTVKQFASKFKCNKSSVLRWINEGRIPGVERIKNGSTKSIFVIPDDAVKPESKLARQGENVEKFAPNTASITDPEHKKQLDFVKNHLSWSVRRIAQTLGVPTSKVRELFDELLQLHNPCNPLDCETYATGHCEYDFATGKIMPMDEENCLLMKKEEK